MGSGKPKKITCQLVKHFWEGGNGGAEEGQGKSASDSGGGVADGPHAEVDVLAQPPDVLGGCECGFFRENQVLCGQEEGDVLCEGSTKVRGGGDEEQVIVIGEIPIWGGTEVWVKEGRGGLIDEVE